MAPSTRQSALQVYQNALDVLSDAIVARDFEGFAAYLHLPHRIVTEHFTTTVDNMAELRRQFAGFTKSLQGMAVDSYNRTARRAEFTTPTTIEGTHSCCLTQNGKLVVPEFEGHMVLEHRDGRWGATQVRHYMRYICWPEISDGRTDPNGSEGAGT